MQMQTSSLFHVAAKPFAAPHPALVPSRDRVSLQLVEIGVPDTAIRNFWIPLVGTILGDRVDPQSNQDPV